MEGTLDVGHEFAGDEDHKLKDVQFRLYGEMLVRLFSRARDRCLDASRLIQVETELAAHARPMDSFGHRTLQDAHDLIEAWYSSPAMMEGNFGWGSRQRITRRGYYKFPLL